MLKVQAWVGGLSCLLVLWMMQPGPPSMASAESGASAPAHLAGSGPLAREKMGMANDAATGRVVLFGGYVFSMDQFASDTWTWDGSAWTPQHPADSPSARCCVAMTYDGARGQVVLFGGVNDQGVTLNDTWTWNGVNWTLQHPAASPDIDPGTSMAFDSASRTVVLFEGHTTQTWSWDGTNWTKKQPSESPSFREDQAMARFGTGVLLFGGNQCGPSDLCELNDTWLWDGFAWVLHHPTNRPTPRCCSGAADDLVHRRLVLFGGLVPTGVLGTTWTWNGATWVRRIPSDSPSPRSFPGMAYDSTRAQVVLFGGFTGGADSGETWVWDGTNWICKAGCSSSRPVPRSIS